MEGLGHAGGSAEAVVGSIKIGEAIGDEDGRQDEEPALAHLGLHPGCLIKRIGGRILHDGFHGLIIIVAERAGLGDDGMRCWVLRA